MSNRISQSIAAIAVAGIVATGAFVSITAAASPAEPTIDRVSSVEFQENAQEAIDRVAAIAEAEAARVEADRVAAEAAAVEVARIEAERVAAEQAAAEQAVRDAAARQAAPAPRAPSAPVVPVPAPEREGGDQQAGECREYNEANECTAVYVP